jgi:hypothetical protein
MESRMWTDVSKEHITSIFSDKNQTTKKPSCSSWLSSILPEDADDTLLRNVGTHTDYDNIHNYRCEDLRSYTVLSWSRLWSSVSLHGLQEAREPPASRAISRMRFKPRTRRIPDRAPPISHQLVLRWNIITCKYITHGSRKHVLNTLTYRYIREDEMGPYMCQMGEGEQTCTLNFDSEAL